MKKRYPEADFLKIAACFFVVLVHSSVIFSSAGSAVPGWLEPVRLLSDTGDTLFMMISACLLFRKPVVWKENIRRKTRSLLVPLVFWNGFWMAAEMILHILFPASFPAVSPSEAVFGLIGIPFYKDPFYVPFWFLCDLFALNILSPLFEKAAGKLPFLLGAASVLLWFSPLNYRVRIPFVFFSFGALFMKQESFRGLIAGIPHLYAIFFSFLAGLIISIGFPQVEAAWRLGIVLLMIGLYHGALWLCEKKNDWNTRNVLLLNFVVYGMHGKILMFLQKIWLKLVPATAMSLSAGYIALAVISAGMCLCLGLMMKRWLPHVFALATGGRVQ